MVHELGVTLAQLYNGAVRRLRITRNVVCSDCEGRGGKVGARKCARCNGQGSIVRMHQIAPGMVQQVGGLLKIFKLMFLMFLVFEPAINRLFEVQPIF